MTLALALAFLASALMIIASFSNHVTKTLMTMVSMWLLP